MELLFSAAAIAKLDPQEMKAYDESLKVLWDNYSIIETAKEEGREKGRMERDIEIAKEMKKEGLPISQIARFTGLSTEDIENFSGWQTANK